jgi:hypothetical protein
LAHIINIVKLTLTYLKNGEGWKAVSRACYRGRFKDPYEYVHRAADAGLLLPTTSSDTLVLTQLAQGIMGR